MNTFIANELLINANRIRPDGNADLYEFVLKDANGTLDIVECVHVESAGEIIYPVPNFLDTLHEVLFELNHVRVNPRLNNDRMITQLITALAEIGVKVFNTPSPQSMAVCYRPLGEITDNVRFYFHKSGECIFLCPNAKLKGLPSTTKPRLNRKNNRGG